MNDVVEIGLAVCAGCGHGRSEHVHCNDYYPALCVHPVDRVEDICWCLGFVVREGESDG